VFIQKALTSCEYGESQSKNALKSHCFFSQFPHSFFSFLALKETLVGAVNASPFFCEKIKIKALLLYLRQIRY
jgi:hypothetical protein